MSTPTQIVDGRGTKNKAVVTNIGQLVTAPFSYDDTQFKELAEVDTAYNFYKPKAGQQAVLTGCIARADKQVSSTVDATVIVYEATSATTTNISKTLLQFAMVQGDIISLLPLNIIVNEGKFINAKTTDDDIHMNLFGYFIPKL